LPFDNSLYLHSHPGFVLVGLLGSFLNILKLFLSVARDFVKSLILRYDGKFAEVKEKKINGGLATADQVRDGEKGLKQNFLQVQSTIQKIFDHGTSQRA
jgi:hypothetical protein